MTNDAKKKDEHIAKFAALGLLRERPGYEVTTMLFAVSDEEAALAQEAYLALMKKYSITGRDLLLVREACAFGIHHMIGNALGQCELENAADSKVKWQ